MATPSRSDLVDRLRGIYTVPVDDGAGPLNGKDTFTRTFPVPPIQDEAANEIQRLRLMVKEMRELMRSSDGVCGLHLNGDDADWRELIDTEWLTHWDE